MLFKGVVSMYDDNVAPEKMQVILIDVEEQIFANCNSKKYTI